jgi:3-oxoacyl-[acyl-carrier protein] reductase
LQLALKNLRVFTLAPGSIDFLGRTGDDAKQNNPKLYAGIRRSIPFDRLGEPSEVANIAVFPASDAASWVRGAIEAFCAVILRACWDDHENPSAF